MGTRTVKLLDALEPNTTYYWRVVAKQASDPSQTSSSDTWSFVTGTGGGIVAVLSATKDAGLRGGAFSGSNYGGQVGGEAEQRLFALGNTSDLFLSPGNAPDRGVAQFDLSSIPSGASLQSATLELAFQILFGARPGSPEPLTIDPLVSSWSEGSITWSNKPAGNSAYRVNAAFPPSGFNPLQLDVTNLVQAWVDGTIANNGMVMAIPAWESETGHAAAFSQREDGASRAPKLTVIYGSPCSAPPEPGTPVPTDTAVDQTSPLTLAWSSGSGTSGYNFYFGDTSSPSEVGFFAANHVDVGSLLPNKTYYWKVEAVSSCDASVTSASPVWSFTTGSCVAPAPPVVSSPADGAGLEPASLDLTWSGVAGADEYDVLLGTSFPPTAVVATTASTGWTAIGLQAETNYYWRVRARKNCSGGLTSESDVAAFSTGPGPVAHAGADVSMAVGGSAQLGGSPSASGGTPPYVYYWIVTPESGAIVAPADSANPTFEGDLEGGYIVQLVVTDANGFSSGPDSVQISVSDTLFADGFEDGSFYRWSAWVP